MGRRLARQVGAVDVGDGCRKRSERLGRRLCPQKEEHPHSPLHATWLPSPLRVQGPRRGWEDTPLSVHGPFWRGASRQPRKQYRVSRGRPILLFYDLTTFFTSFLLFRCFPHSLPVYSPLFKRYSPGRTGLRASLLHSICGKCPVVQFNDGLPSLADVLPLGAVGWRWWLTHNKTDKNRDWGPGERALGFKKNHEERMAMTMHKKEQVVLSSNRDGAICREVLHSTATLLRHFTIFYGILRVQTGLAPGVRPLPPEVWSSPERLRMRNTTGLAGSPPRNVWFPLPRASHTIGGNVRIGAGSTVVCGTRRTEALGSPTRNGQTAALCGMKHAVAVCEIQPLTATRRVRSPAVCSPRAMALRGTRCNDTLKTP